MFDKFIQVEVENQRLEERSKLRYFKMKSTFIVALKDNFLTQNFKSAKNLGKG